jgi:hypothetical protein
MSYAHVIPYVRKVYSHIKNRMQAKKEYRSHMANFENKETNISYMNLIIHIQISDVIVR